MERERHSSEADNAKCVVGAHPDNWVKNPIVGPAGACFTTARATCGFAVDHDGAETVGADRMFLFEDFRPIGAHGFHGGVGPALHAEVTAED